MTKKLSFMLLAACGVTFSPLALAQQGHAAGPIVVQGAMPVEAERFAQRLDNPREEQIGGWRFWHGTLDGYPVVVSETQKGMSNAAAATAIAATRFHPVAIINQGTAGGHDPALKVYDIVLGKYSVSLGAFKTPKKAAGEGSDSRQWQPMDLLASKGSAGEDKNVHSIRQFPADAKLLAIAEGVKASYTRGKVVEGVIGSADVWNSELDRISHFRQVITPRLKRWKRLLRRRSPLLSLFRLSVSGCFPTILPIRVNTTANRAGMPGLCLSGGEGLYYQRRNPLRFYPDQWLAIGFCNCALAIVKKIKPIARLTVVY